MFLRLALRPDRAMFLAALGIAAGILLPVTGNLVLAGLEPRIDARVIVYATEGDIDPAPGASWVVARSTSEPTHYAFIQGDPRVARGAMLVMPEAKAAGGTPRAGGMLDGVPADAWLLHPADLGPSRVVAAGYPGDAPALHGNGWIVASARGVDAFEVATTTALRSQGIWLLVLSLPAVAMVAIVFAGQEVRARRRQTAVIVSLGRRRVAWALLLVRVLACVAAGAFIATAIGFLLYTRGPPLLHPVDAPRTLLAMSIAVPSLVAAIAGAIVSTLALRDLELLRADASGDEDDVRLAIPARVRPLLLGLRPMILLWLAAALFMADVGFPIAAAKVPASLGGTDDEWVVGAEDGLVAGQGVDASAAVLRYHEDVKAVVAESLAPTFANGKPLVVRGGEWAALAGYHRLSLASGHPPEDGEVALGERAARRLGLGPGDPVVLQLSSRPGIVVARVSGIVTGPDLFRDEGFVAEPLGRQLAGVKPGQASLVRLRPASDAVLDALAAEAPDLRVVGIEAPDDPVIGSVAVVNATLVNLGTKAGHRALTLRVNDVPASTVQAIVGGRGTRIVQLPFLVGGGSLRFEVNPSAEGSSQESSQSWSTPDQVLVGDRFVATLTDKGVPVTGRDVGLFRDLAAASSNQSVARNRTDERGAVAFVVPVAGEWYVGTLNGTRTFARFVAVAPAGGIKVVDLWTVGAPQVGEQTAVQALVLNTGTERNATTFAARADGATFAFASADLLPGESTVLSFPLRPAEAIKQLEVGGRTLDLGTLPAPSTPTAPDTPADPTSQPIAGEVAQTQVANRALGDANAILAGLGTAATATTMAVVVLSTRRALAGRGHVLGVLVALGWDQDRIRQRAAFEGAALGGVAAASVLLPAKLTFIVVGEWGPAVFAHGLPDPIGWLFSLQAVAAFAGVCALAAYFGAARATQG